MSSLCLPTVNFKAFAFLQVVFYAALLDNFQFGSCFICSFKLSNSWFGAAFSFKNCIAALTIYEKFKADFEVKCGVKLKLISFQFLTFYRATADSKKKKSTFRITSIIDPVKNDDEDKADDPGECEGVLRAIITH